MDSNPLNVASVGKAFRVLDAFSQATGDLSLGEIAIITGLDKSAAQRFAHTLWTLGYLEKDERTRRFRLGGRILDLTFSYLRLSPLIERATPALVELRRAIGERVNLSLFDDLTLVYAIRLQSKREYFYGSLIGRRVPIFCSAGGRAILSKLPADQVADILARSDLSPKNPKTITSPERILAKIEEARQNGYATAQEEVTQGELTLGVAVCGGDGRPVAAIHVAGSLSEWTVEDFAARFAPLAMETAQTLSRSAAVTGGE